MGAGASCVGSRAWSLRRQLVVSPNSRAKEEGKEKGAFREARYLRRAGEGAPSSVPLTIRCGPNLTPAGPKVQVEQLILLLTSLCCSEAVLGDVQKAVKAKAKPRVVRAAEHAVFVLQEKWDRAVAHFEDSPGIC